MEAIAMKSDPSAMYCPGQILSSHQPIQQWLACRGMGCLPATPPEARSGRCGLVEESIWVEAFRIWVDGRVSAYCPVGICVNVSQKSEMKGKGVYQTFPNLKQVDRRLAYEV